MDSFVHTEPKVYTVSAYSTHTHIHIRREKRETFDGRTKARTNIQYRDNKNNKVDKK